MDKNTELAALEDYLESLRLGRDILDVMLGGRSAIDTRGGLLPTQTIEKAEEFIAAYGYKVDEPIAAAELQGLYQESLRFIRKYFLKPENPEGLELEIPPLFFELQDVRKIFIFATDKNNEHIKRRNWSCSILRVMHTLSHLEKEIKADYFSTVQKQVFDRFYKEIYNVEDRIFLGDPKGLNPIELRYFQTKPRKSRESQVLKLLHKEENVAEDIYDQVGVRFVTKSRMDGLRVLKYLRDHHVVMPANMKPSRSRNRLVDPFLYRRIWREARFDVQKELLRSPGEVDSFIENRLITEGRKAAEASKNADNPFSNKSYSAIQFTCRQLIKHKSPVYDDIRKLKKAIKKSDNEELQKLADRVELSKVKRETAFFYPYEVQIMDERSYEESQSGAAAHKSYKAAQIQVAALRVLGDLAKSSKA